MMLCAFMAAAHARTPSQRDHLGDQWAKVLKKADLINQPPAHSSRSATFRRRGWRVACGDR